MALARETGDRVREAVSLFNLGGLLCAESDWQRAQAYLRQSVQLRRDFGDRKGEGNALGSLGDVAMNLGDYALAADYFDESLALAREVGDRMGECWVLGSQALQSLHTNDFIRAQMHSEQAFALAECTGLRHAQARPLTILGQALIGQQRLEEAHAAYLRSLNLRRDLGETSQTLDALAGLAEVALLQGHLEVARNYAEEMLPLFIPFSEADEPFRARLICYRVLCACNDPQSAALAVKLLDDSRKLLAASAASIDDLKMRDSFMHRVLVNRILLG